MVTYSTTVTLPVPSPAWLATTTYALGARVSRTGRIYESLQANNLNHGPPNAVWWDDLGAPFDNTGVNDISDQLLDWITSGRAGNPGPLNIPNGPSPLVHTRVLFPRTAASHANMELDATGNTTRAQYRVEGGATGHMDLVGFKNVTFDGLGTPGTEGADGAEFISRLKQIYGAICSNPLGLTRVDGKTTAADKMLTATGSQRFTPGMVGMEIALDPNRAYQINSITWSAPAGGTLTVVTAIPHGMAPGTRVEIRGCANDAYNFALLVSSVPNPTTFTFANFGANPGAAGGSPQIFFSVNYRTVASYISPTQIVHSGGSMGTFGDAADPVTQHRAPIRWTTLPRIAAKNYVAGTYRDGARVASGGKVYQSNVNGNNTAPPSASWLSLGNIDGTTNKGPDNADYSTPAAFRGAWQVIYVPTNIVRPGSDDVTGSDANGDSQTRASTEASKDGGSRNLFWLKQCEQVRFIRFAIFGTYASNLFGGGYDPNNETQCGFIFAGCTDCEIGDCEIANQWGNGFETFPGTNPNGSARATMGLWVHDSHIHGFGRQTLSIPYAGNVIIERCNLHGSARTLMDVEPVVSYSNKDVRLSNLVQDLHIYDNTIGHHGLGGLISLHSATRVHMRGNTGDTLGSGGTTWVADDVIYDSNDETGNNALNDYIGFVRVSTSPGQPSEGGQNVWIHNNTGVFARVTTCHFHASFISRAIAPSIGVHTNTLSADTLTVDDASSHPPSGTLSIGDPYPTGTTITYTSHDNDHFFGCTGNGPDRILGSGTPIYGMNGATNYSVVNNQNTQGGVPFIDDNNVKWQPPFVPFTVDPMPHVLRDEIVGGPNPQTIIAAAIPPRGIGNPTLLTAAPPGTATSLFLLENGSYFLLEDGSSRFLLENDNVTPPTGTTSFLTEDDATLLAEDGTPLLIEQDIAGPVIQPAGIASTVRFGAPALTGPGFAPIIFATGIAPTIEFGIPSLGGVRIPIQIGLPTTDDILNGLLPVRSDSFEFELIDSAGVRLGDLDVGADVAATMRMDTSRTTFRTLSGVEVFRADLSQIDVEHERLKVTMVLQNGARFPLGVLMFGQDNRAPASWGTKFTPELFDEVFLIDQDLDATLPGPIGASVYDLITILLAPFKYEVLIDLPDVAVAAPLMFPVSSSRYAALAQCATLLGCFAPHFDNEHRFHFKSAQLSGDTTVDHTYTSGYRLIEEQMQLQNSSYKAPNKYIVDSGDPVNPVVGIYDLPPSAPHSAFNRDGRVVTTSRTVQGLLTVEAARQAAYVDALTDRTAYGRINFAATADPRHDSFDTMEVLGVRYLETAWTLELVSGGVHTHEGTTLWQA